MLGDKILPANFKSPRCQWIDS